jgi:Amt family ammonium transporter
MRYCAFVLGSFGVSGGSALAADETAAFGETSHLNQAATAAEAAALNSGDTAWVLIATALVLLMTMPALALFYGGLVRSRNVLSIFMQCLTLTALVSVLWMVCGYSLAFEASGIAAGTVTSSSFVGGMSKAMMFGITASSMHGTIPELLFVVFQMMFAVIATALITGAFAERMKFSAVLLFSALWLIVVYCPICHMTWASNAGAGGYLSAMGVMDYAGGIVVHITAGFSALVACVMIGPRAGYPKRLEPPHNMTMTATGTAMLWVAWFGFNGGSHLVADGGAAMAILVTHLSASAATLVWVAIEWTKLGKPSFLGAATGAIAGLAAITPASGFVGPLGGLVIGAASSCVCYAFATNLKAKFGFDDALDVFGVHGVGGFLGTVLVGIFASAKFGGSRENLDVVGALGIQAFAAVLTAVYAIVATFIILRLVDLSVGLRVDGNTEDRGLDISEHEERGYNL